MFSTKKRIYLDYAAATPLSKNVSAAMRPFFNEHFGNASAIHTEGMIARQAVEEARAKVAKVLQVRPEFVTFTSGGTESNNLAIVGTLEKLLETGRAFEDMEVVTTKIEHPSVMNTMDALKRRGVIVKYAEVNSEGFVIPDELQKLLTEKTVLFSVAYANSEIGAVQKLHALKKVLTAAEKKFEIRILFHLDAAQAPLWLSCQFDALHADLLALDVGKCHGPKGMGILVHSRRAVLAPTVFGGGQESGLRPGTENVAAVVGASVALEEAQKNFKVRAQKVMQIRDAATKWLLKEIPNAVLNGPVGEDRLANNINISIPGLDTEFATIVLDKHGFAVSTKSACAGAGGGESMVVKVISCGSAVTTSTPEQAQARAISTLRISLSPETTLQNLKDLVSVLKLHIEKMRIN